LNQMNAVHHKSFLYDPWSIFILSHLRPRRASSLLPSGLKKICILFSLLVFMLHVSSVTLSWICLASDICRRVKIVSLRIKSFSTLSSFFVCLQTPYSMRICTVIYWKKYGCSFIRSLFAI
jgi:hypothetical protein